MPYGYGSANKGSSGSSSRSYGPPGSSSRRSAPTHQPRSRPAPVTTGGPPIVLNPPTTPITTGGPPRVLNPPPKGRINTNGGIAGIKNRNILNWLKSRAGKYTGYTQHNINNQMLRNALAAGEITEEQYKLMGGYDVAQNMPLNLGSNYKNVGIASGLYNALKSGVSAFTGSPYAKYGNIGPLESIALNTQGATGLGKKNQMMYEDIIGGKKFFSNENEMYNIPKTETAKRIAGDTSGTVETGMTLDEVAEDVKMDNMIKNLDFIDLMRTKQKGTKFYDAVYEPKELEAAQGGLINFYRYGGFSG